MLKDPGQECSWEAKEEKIISISLLPQRLSMVTSDKPVLWQQNLHIVFGVTLIAVLGVSSITPVFPLVREVFGISAGQVGLLITMFTLPGVILSPLLGVLADRWGRKKILVPSLFLFAVAGTWCGFTTDFGWLVFFRFLQGTGAAAIGALNITLIGDLYAGKERASAMGYNASVLSIGTASYPAIGGALATIAWNYPFFLPVLALPVGLFVIFSLDNPEPSGQQSLHLYLQAVMRSFRSKTVIGLFLISCLTFILLYGSFLTYLPLHLDEQFNMPPYQIGLILSFSSIATAIVSTQLGPLTARISYKNLLIIVNVVYVISMVIIPITANQWWMLLPSGLFGVAQGINIPALQTLLAGSAPLEYRAAFLSANGTVLRLGQTLGPVVIGMVYLGFGMGATFYAGALIAVTMGFIVLVLIAKTTGH
jgi:MFS family permease